jgi:hypothetical protein
MKSCIADSGTDLVPLGDVIVHKKLLEEVECFNADIAHSLLCFSNQFLLLS